MRHDRGNDAIGLENGQHVLEEHEVGFLAILGCVAIAEPFLVGERGLVVVLAERGVGDHPVESDQLTVTDVVGVAEGVVVAEVSVSDAVEQHVHLRDRPCGPVVLLPGENQIGGIATIVSNVVAGVDQHAARARARVVDSHTFLRIDKTHHQLHDRAGRVELAALLAGRVGKVADQILVCGAEQVGELEILVAEPVLREVIDEVAPLLVRNDGSTDPPVEVDVLQHTLQRGIALLERAESSVQPIAHLMVDIVANVPPASLGWHEERVLVEIGVIGSLFGFLR